ncbi:MAG: hypothetical protein Q9213_005839 [Squamulea squamosa]
MSIDKESPDAFHDPSDESPPSYSESLGNSQPSPDPVTQRVRTLISIHIGPNLNEDKSITTLAIVPSNVSPLFAPSATSPPKDSTSFAYPGEKLVGFTSYDNPTLIRLSGPDNSLEFWQRPSTLHELHAQICQDLVSQGHKIVVRPPSPPNVTWKFIEVAALKEGEARVDVEMKEVCLRIENAMGLYETRTGKAIVVRVEIAHVEDRWNLPDEDWYE